MTLKISRKIFFIFLIVISLNAYGNEEQSNHIEVLVNENIITKFDIIQKLKIHSILKRVEIDDNNYSQILNSIIDDLIVEKLKIRKIEEYNINFNKDEFSKFEKRFYSSLNYSKQDLEDLFSLNDINFSYLIETLEVDLKWQKLIYGLYLRITSVTEQEINELISKNPDLNEETASDLILQKQLDLKSMKLIKDLRNEATIEYK